MEYEKIIVELLSRIQTLEEQVAVLMKQQTLKEGTVEDKMNTDDIRNYIQEQKTKARIKDDKKVKIGLIKGNQIPKANKI